MPPGSLYFQGNLIIPKGIVLGTNHDEFWLAIKLKEVDSYWSGPNAKCIVSELPVSPASIMEALGYVWLDSPNRGGYTIQYKSPYDIITVLEDDKRPAKRIWLWSCDSSPRRIEYLDTGGQAVLTAELTHYAAVQGDFAVPTRIELTARGKDEKGEKLLVELNKDTLEVFTPTPQQVKALFERPEPTGIGHVLMLTEDCRFIEIKTGH